MRLSPRQFREFGHHRRGSAGLDDPQVGAGLQIENLSPGIGQRRISEVRARGCGSRCRHAPPASSTTQFRLFLYTPSWKAKVEIPGEAITGTRAATTEAL